MSLNPSHLRTFLAVYKHANYTRAAKELFLTQPAVSRQIDQLEKELGVPLFEQIGKTIHVTEAGRKLQHDAERLLGDMERIAESVRALGSPGHGRIAVGASSTPGLYLLPSAIGKFRRRFPNVDLQYSVENSQRIAEKVLRNELDLGFVGVPPVIDSLQADELCEDRIVFFAARGHALASRREVELSELARETWVIREKGSATRELLQSRLGRRRLAPPSTIEMNCPEGVKLLVAAGAGVSYMSECGLADAVSRARFRILNVRGVELRRSLFVIRHRNKHISPLLAEFLRLAAADFSRGERTLLLARPTSRRRRGRT